MSRWLVLVRHSLPEIKKNLPAREWKLSVEGRVQVERLAEGLTGYRPGMLASSPEPKAVETAAIVAGRFRLPVLVIEDLHEHERSKVDFLSSVEFDASVQEFFDKPDRLVFGSETANEACQRFSRAMSSIPAVSDENSTVVVSHGTVISLFVSRLTGQPGFQVWTRLGLPGFIVLDMESKDMIAFENTF